MLFYRDMDKLLKNLQNRGFIPHLFDTTEQAKDFFANELSGVSVGMGGSMTIDELGLYELLKQRNTVYSHTYCKDDDELKNASLADVYISSANAISEDGEIVNIDGRGNRVSSIIWGANRKRVYIVAGSNKIVPDLPSAIVRAKNIAAPKNAMRLERKTPCALKADKCYKCNSPDKICRVMTIQTHPTSAETHVVLIRQEIGY